ncbi:MAG: putative N-acetylmannosamine-6-phosphate 2-epimerase [Candidatus Eremiobacteraeota bacterium]|nr:putative N-acetylmannosamine-6-phosphate 2-epimerase [Candidatus Eremiobacteraeota bacterium]
MSDARERLRGGLIVSVQAYADSVLNEPDAIVLLARCAVQNGAVGLRVEGERRIAAVRAATAVPLVGIIKRAHAGFEPYITSTRDEIAAVARAGATIVAFDATGRPRADASGVGDLVVAAHEAGLLAMADCATLADLTAAAQAGADIVATTLAGYTQETAGRSLPALDLVGEAAKRHPFAVCEGGIGEPDAARAAFAAGASAVVVGTAITNVDELVRRFVRAVPRST